MPKAATDRWLEWLVRGRDAGDAELRCRAMQLLLPIRDEVLDRAGIRPQDTVLDVGTGEGLLGIGALERVGSRGHVMFSDVSPALLERSREAVAALGATNRASFVIAPAETLAGVPDASVDVILWRSVLIYITDRKAAFHSFARVLRPGGRLAMYEPIASFFPLSDHPPGWFFGWEVEEVAEAVTIVRQRFWECSGEPAANPLLTLTVQELIGAAESAGFADITATLTAISRAQSPGDEAAMRRALHGRPNPNVPSPAEAARDSLPAADAERFLAALERAVVAGRGRLRQASAIMSAVLPCETSELSQG